MFETFSVDAKYADVVATALQAENFEITGEQLSADGCLSHHVERIYFHQAVQVTVQTIINNEHGYEDEAKATLREANRILEFFYR